MQVTYKQQKILHHSNHLYKELEDSYIQSIFKDTFLLI